MRWHDVLWIIGREVKADGDLAAIYGDAMRMAAKAQNLLVPSLEWFVVSDTGSELWEPCTVQIDQWVNDLESLVLSEAALRALFDQALPVTFTDPSGGRDLVTWCVFSDGAELTSPDRSGFYGRAARFRFTPLRDCLRGGRS